MSSRKRSNNKPEVLLTDMYALKFSALWNALKAEHVSLWMLCGYFFFEYVRPQNLYPVLDILPWGMFFLIASAITALADKSARWESNIENKLFIAFTLVLILSGIFAFKPSVSANYATVFGSWFMVYFITIRVVNTEKRLLLFILAYCLFNFKMSQHGAVVWSMRGFSFAKYGINGSPGWFHNSGEYAIQMLIFGCLASSLIIALKEHWGKYKKIFFILAAGTSFLAVMGASSRGSQVALAVIAIWVLLKQKGGFKGLIGLLVLCALLYGLLTEEQLQRFNEMGNDTNSLQRLAYWEYAIDHVIPESPILGVGYNNWLTYVWFQEPAGIGPMQKIQESHNIFIQVTSELGFLGLFMFLLLVIFAFVNNVRTRKMAKMIDNKLMFSLTYGLDAGMIGYLVAGNFVTVFYYPFFWIQITMIVMLNSVTKKQWEEMGFNKQKRRRFSSV